MLPEFQTDDLGNVRLGDFELSSYCPWGCATTDQCTDLADILYFQLGISVALSLAKPGTQVMRIIFLARPLFRVQSGYIPFASRSSQHAVSMCAWGEVLQPHAVWMLTGLEDPFGDRPAGQQPDQSGNHPFVAIDAEPAAFVRGASTSPKITITPFREPNALDQSGPEFVQIDIRG